MKDKPFKRPAFAAALVACAFTAGCVYETTPRYTETTVIEQHRRPGYIVRTLPQDHQVEVYRGTRYYRHGGLYYRPHSRGYVVVERPDTAVVRYGTTVRTLPSGHRVVTHRGARYYVHDGVYYRPRGDRYVIVERPF